MRANLLTLVCLLSLSACEPWKDITSTDGGTTKPGDLSCPASPDQGVPPVKCSAAKGLSGDNLLCADFATAQTLVDLTSDGWSFTTAMSGTCTGWTVSNSKLLVNNFAGLTGSCGILTKPINANDPKYNSFTLSVVQTVDINATKQGAYIYLGLDVTPQQVWYTTGTYVKTVTTIQIAKADLPNGGNGIYQPFLKVTSSAAGGGFTGWQIESIAVNGNP